MTKNPTQAHAAASFMPAVDIWRGMRVESTHNASIVVVRDDGSVIFSWGDVAQKVFPRSALKLIQALPLIMSGAADAFKIDERMMALSCSSHSGEPEHAKLAAEMLHSVGLDEGALECGTHWPLRGSAMRDMAKQGEQPTTLHNPCSGKHSGFLAGCQTKKI